MRNRSLSASVFPGLCRLIGLLALLGSFASGAFASIGVSATTSLSSPRPVNTAITLTAAATGGPEVQYQFWVYNVNANPAWSQLQGYSTSPTCTWTPTSGGRLPALRHRTRRRHRHGGEHDLLVHHYRRSAHRGVRRRRAGFATAGRHADYLHRRRDGRHERAVSVLGV